eukprot:m.166628 g.166628  ORF g.166628 m.166628 type:complete len:442 (-) comp15287_c0_seq2:2693-4018(-)
MAAMPPPPAVRAEPSNIINRNNEENNIRDNNNNNNNNHARRLENPRFQQQRPPQPGDGQQQPQQLNGRVPPHLQGPQNDPQDSEEHDVKYLGRLPIEATREKPPDGRTCSIAVNYLSRLRSRKKFRYGVAKNMKFIISARRGAILCNPASENEEGRKMKCSLTEVTCVADHDNFVCFVSGKMRDDGSLLCWAHAYECESAWASRYLAEEIVHACRVAFARARRASAEAAAIRATQAAVAAERAAAVAAEAAATAVEAASEAEKAKKEEERTSESPKNSKKKKEPRDPDEGDKIFYHQEEILKRAVHYRERPPLKESASDRGDGKFWNCCQNLGSCKCSERGKPVSNSKTTKPSRAPDHGGLKVGDVVYVHLFGQGTIRYIGNEINNPDSEAMICGVEFDKAVGNCDGSFENERYFECKQKYGLVFPLGKYPMTIRGKRKAK